MEEPRTRRQLLSVLQDFNVRAVRHQKQQHQRPGEGCFTALVCVFASEHMNRQARVAVCEGPRRENITSSLHSTVTGAYRAPEGAHRGLAEPLLLVSLLHTRTRTNTRRTAIWFLVVGSIQLLRTSCWDRLLLPRPKPGSGISRMR